MSTPGTRPPLDCYEGDPELLPATLAWERVRARVATATAIERVSLRGALDRVLAEDVISPHDVPAHTNSAMDGYALAGEDLPAGGNRTLEVLGTSWAGKPFDGACRSGCAVQILTGAVMPAGADTVIMQEQVEREGDRITIGPGHRVGQNVRAAGEDIGRGDTVLAPGLRLGPAELGLVGSLGIGELDVRRRLRVATFSTGDELRSLGEPLGPGAIYDSNRYTLYGMLERLHAEVLDLGVVRDDLEQMRAAFREATAAADVVITSGGASTGEADFVQQVLTEQGEVGFWRIAIRPGRPLAFGRLGGEDGAMFFGLPGNPVAVMITFYQFVQPALRIMMGERDAHPEPMVRARTVSRLRKKPGRVEYYRAVLERGEDGEPVVRHTGPTGSGLLHTMSEANCLVILDHDAETVEPGALVDVQPFHGLT